MIEYATIVLGIATCLIILIWVRCCTYYERNHLRHARLMNRKANWIRKLGKDLERKEGKYLQEED